MCVGFFRTGLLLFWVFECFHLFVWAPQEFSRKGWRGKGGGVGTFGLKKKKIMVSFVTKQYPPPKKTKKLAPPFKKKRTAIMETAYLFYEYVMFRFEIIDDSKSVEVVNWLDPWSPGWGWIDQVALAMFPRPPSVPSVENPVKLGRTDSTGFLPGFYRVVPGCTGFYAVFSRENGRWKAFFFCPSSSFHLLCPFYSAPRFSCLSSTSLSSVCVGVCVCVCVCVCVAHARRALLIGWRLSVDRSTEMISKTIGTRPRSKSIERRVMFIKNNNTDIAKCKWRRTLKSDFRFYRVL